MNASSGYTFFETALGHCGIAWSDSGIVRLQLPEQNLQMLKTRFTGCGVLFTENSRLPGFVSTAIQKICRSLTGEQQSFSELPLDMKNLPKFHAKIYTVLRQVPFGQVTTYGELARAVDSPNSARAVGQAMARNPFPIIVPCHRVLASGGGLGGFSAYGGSGLKERLLAAEGVRLCPV